MQIFVASRKPNSFFFFQFPKSWPPSLPRVCFLRRMRLRVRLRWVCLRLLPALRHYTASATPRARRDTDTHSRPRLRWPAPCPDPDPRPNPPDTDPTCPPHSLPAPVWVRRSRRSRRSMRACTGWPRRRACLQVHLSACAHAELTVILCTCYAFPILPFMYNRAVCYGSLFPPRSKTF